MADELNLEKTEESIALDIPSVTDSAELSSDALATDSLTEIASSSLSSSETSEDPVEEASGTPESAESESSDLAEISELKKNLSKDLKIIDEALTDDEFLAKINSRTVFHRFEKYLRTNARTLGDFEAILKSWFLQLLLLIGIGSAVGLFYYGKTFYGDEQRKALIGYIKVNHKLPEGFKGNVDHELQEIVEHYVKPYEKHAEKEEAHAEAKPLASDKYPGIISNPQLLLILEEQGVGKVTASGTEYTEKINLSGLDLRSVNFKYLNRFIQSDLRKVNLKGVTIEEVQFRGANLEEAELSETTLREANFIRAKLSNTRFKSAELSDANFYGAAGVNIFFYEATLARVNFKEVDFLEADFENALVIQSNFESADLQGANFMGADLRQVNFKGANLTAANFRSANLEGANFKDAILDGANFAGANMLNASLEKASLNNAFLGEANNLTMEQLEIAQFAYNAETLPEWVNQKKLSWQRRF